MTVIKHNYNNRLLDDFQAIYISCPLRYVKQEKNYKRH